MEELELLRRRYEELKRRLEEMEQEKRELEGRLSEASAMAAEEISFPATSPLELERILSRLVKKVGMIIQAEKCLFMLYEPSQDVLVAQKPALGLSEEQIKDLCEPLKDGFSGQAFTSGKPLVIEDFSGAEEETRLFAAKVGAKNSLSVPLVVERRDENFQVMEKQTIGVLHVFNKRFGVEFTEEDVRLLQILARQLASVISGARAFFKLAEEKRRLETTIESMMAGVIMVGKDGKVSLMNAAARRIFGVGRGEKIFGKFYREVITNEKVQSLISTTLTSDEEGRDEITVELPEREGGKPKLFIFQVQSTPARDEGGKMVGVVAIMTDITQIRMLEQMKTAFVSAVSHELRTPLTSIKGFVSTLLSDTEGYFDLETRREFLQIVDQETDRLKRLIDDLLNLSRIESGEALRIRWKKFNLREVAKRIIKVHKTYADKHTLIMDVPEDIEVVADEDKVDQIITNLINNAIKYSPDGGEVRVFARCVDDEWVEVAVSDQGIGIPPEEREKVFDKFYRMDDETTLSRGGTGLGLYLVKNLVEAHGGKIWVESEGIPGKGSTFFFTLPKRRPEGEEVAENSQDKC